MNICRPNAPVLSSVSDVNATAAVGTEVRLDLQRQAIEHIRTAQLHYAALIDSRASKRSTTASAAH